jgi:drug/metabolite transporter (DMT)-like permease
MLVLVTLFWGVSFPLMKDWQTGAAGCPGGEELATTTLIAVRMILGFALLAVFQPQLWRQATLREHVIGGVIGVTFALGFGLQVWGLATTTPALSAFITSLGSAWVPLLAFVFLRLPVAGITVLGLGLGIAGTAVLSLNVDEKWILGIGEGRTFVASLLFAVQILLLDRLGRQVRSSYLTMGFLGVTALMGVLLSLGLAGTGPGVGVWLAWLGGLLAQPRVLIAVALLVLLPTVLAFHWMNAYQPRVSAGRAALIYLLEPVFAAAFSVVWGHDALTWRLFAGGGLILGGNLLIEVPYWLEQWWRRRPA